MPQKLNKAGQMQDYDETNGRWLGKATPNVITDLNAQVSRSNKLEFNLKGNNEIKTPIANMIKANEEIKEENHKKYSSKDYDVMSDVDLVEQTYNGEYIDGYYRENWGFSKGDKIIIADAWVNARSEKEALNKVKSRIGAGLVNNDDLEDELKYFSKVEEANYYDEKNDKKYKYYVSTTIDKNWFDKWGKKK